MGWNEAGATLMAPGWRMTSQVTSKKSSGGELRILEPEKDEEASITRIKASDLCAWLRQRGFQLTEGAKYETRFQREDIEAFLGIREEAVAEVILTFMLSKHSPLRWDKWKSLVESLCESWNFAIYDPQRGFMVASSELLRVLSQTKAWSDFAANFKWQGVS